MNAVADMLEGGNVQAHFLVVDCGFWKAVDPHGLRTKGGRHDVTCERLTTTETHFPTPHVDPVTGNVVGGLFLLPGEDIGMAVNFPVGEKDCTSVVPAVVVCHFSWGKKTRRGENRVGVAIWWKLGWMVYLFKSEARLVVAHVIRVRLRFEPTTEAT